MKKGYKIGLALGGGAALGAAHIGVLKAIEELEIEISFISGTSIGAFVAAFYANGKNSAEIQAITKDLEWLDISGFTLSKFGLLSNEKLGKLIMKHLGDLEIQDAKIPAAMIATDIKTGEKITLNEGKIAQAAMASTCIPGVFIPVQMKDRWLVDGGLVENVPLSPLKEMGADFIIAVDLNTNQTFRKPENIIEKMNLKPIELNQVTDYHELNFTNMMECAGFLAGLSRIFDAPHRINYHVDLSDAEVWVYLQSKSDIRLYLNEDALYASNSAFEETPITKIIAIKSQMPP